MPARNATLQLGLLSIPVKTMKATETKQSNKTLCVGQPGHDAHDAKAISAPYTCTCCGIVTDSTSLLKGVPQADGTFAVITQDELAETRDEFTKEFKEVVNLVAHPAADILNDTAPGDSLNYLLPNTKGACAQGCKGCPICRYALLVRLITNHPEIVFTALYTPTSATNLFILRVHDGVLLMEKRVRAGDLRERPAIPVPAEFKDKLYGQLESFLEVEPYEAEAYEDTYAAALAVIAAKAEAITLDGATSTPATVVPTISDDDLFAKLAALKAAS